MENGKLIKSRVSLSCLMQQESSSFSLHENNILASHKSNTSESSKEPNKNENQSFSRRLFFKKQTISLLLQPLLISLVPNTAYSIQETTKKEQSTTTTTTSNDVFVSAAFPKKEYTNSIVASRDTNVSPLEVYETIQNKLQIASGNNGRALDVGAGAGVSTQVLYDQLEYKTIDAIDWSGTAWETFVVEQGQCPSTVQFYEMDDERFVKYWQRTGLPKYDIIAFNFAVNYDKAKFFAQNLMQDNGVLLAPVNTQRDYWLKQTYILINKEGKILWSANDVGAWSVQFQPDVTQDTCQGIWCPPYNGFQKLGK